MTLNPKHNAYVASRHSKLIVGYGIEVSDALVDLVDDEDMDYMSPVDPDSPLVYEWDDANNSFLYLPATLKAPVVELAPPASPITLDYLRTLLINELMARVPVNKRTEDTRRLVSKRVDKYAGNIATVG